MKNVKKILSILAASILALGVMLISACGAPTAYTVYVQDENGNAISGVQIGICIYDETTGEKSMCLPLKASDESGKVVLEADEATYAINEDTLGSYKCKETYVLKAYGEYTIVLVAD